MKLKIREGCRDIDRSKLNICRIIGIKLMILAKRMIRIIFEIKIFLSFIRGFWGFGVLGA